MAVSFANLKVGWAVGHFHTILKTGNSGRTWVKQRYKLPKGWAGDFVFTSVQAISTKTCWVVGTGLVLKTVNGGKTWVRKAAKMYNPDPGFDWWNHVAFANAKVGWALSTVGDVMKTTNGGKTWKWQRKFGSGPAEAGCGISAANVHSVFVSGGSGTGGHVLCSADGGATWTESRAGIANWTITAVKADTASNVWITTENGSVFVSKDGGTSWTPSHWGSWTGPFYGLDTAGGTLTCAVGTNGDFTLGEAWLSRDAGTSWSHLDLGGPNSATTAYPLEAVDFVNAKTGWMVGDHGQIDRTEDGGKTFQKQN